MFNAYNLTPIVQNWSFSDVMFATKKNMTNAVATVSKQLENVHETLAVSSFYWLLTSFFYFFNNNLSIFSLSVADHFCLFTLQSTKRHIIKRLDGLGLEVEKQNEISKQIAEDVSEVNFPLV